MHMHVLFLAANYGIPSDLDIWCVLLYPSLVGTLHVHVCDYCVYVVLFFKLYQRFE